MHNHMDFKLMLIFGKGMILFQYFAVKQDQELGREFVKCLKVAYLILFHSEGPKLSLGLSE